MAKKVFTTGKAYGNETEYRLYVDGNRTETRYDTSGDTFKNLMYDDFVHGYTTAQLRKAEEEFNYWKEHLEMMKNSPIVEDNEEHMIMWDNMDEPTQKAFSKIFGINREEYEKEMGMDIYGDEE